jgi:hypothetical protein
MTMIGGGLRNFHRGRTLSAGWTLLFLLQKTLFILLGAMLMALLLIALPAGSALQMHAQTASAPVSSSVPEHQDLPDAPSAMAALPQSSQTGIPFLSPQYSRPLQPMGLGDKFKYLVEPTFGPRALFTTAFSTGIRMANPPNRYPHEWRAGAEAFGRNYGDSFARTGAESIGRFSAAVLLHEDPRYRRSESTFVPVRLAHALAFTFVDRTDGGHTTIAISNFTGAAAGGFIGNAYLPAGFDNLTHAGQRSAIAFGGLAGQNVMQEFAPDLAHVLRKIHAQHVPMPPVWWTGDK